MAKKISFDSIKAGTVLVCGHFDRCMRWRYGKKYKVISVEQTEVGDVPYDGSPRYIVESDKMPVSINYIDLYFNFGVGTERDIAVMEARILWNKMVSTLDKAGMHPVVDVFDTDYTIDLKAVPNGINTDLVYVGSEPNKSWKNAGDYLCNRPTIGDLSTWYCEPDCYVTNPRIKEKPAM